MPNILDRLLGRGGDDETAKRSTSPTTRREFHPRYGPTGPDRLTADLPSHPTGANDRARRDRTKTVAHARHVYRHGSIARSAVDSTIVGVIGSGVGFQSRADTDNGQAAVEAAWREWSAAEHCDVAGRASLVDVMRQVLASYLVNGEALVLKHRGSDFGRFGFQLQVLDPERLDANLNREMRGGTFIEAGVEMDRLGRPVAYHVRESAGRLSPLVGLPSAKSIRVPADNVIHMVRRDEPEQVRGLPWLAPVLPYLHHLDRYFEAAVVNARTGAANMGFLESDDNDDIEGEVPVEVDPGAMIQLPAGVRFQGFNPGYPTGEFDPFVRSCLRTIAAGLGISYATLAGDLSDVNYSSIRQGALDERDTWRALQDRLVVEFCAPVFSEWLDAALLARAITARGTPFGVASRSVLDGAVWTPRRWQWVDPLKETNAQIAAIKAGLRSPSEIVREQGRDFDEVVAETARDLAALRDAGIDVLGGAR